MTMDLRSLDPTEAPRPPAETTFREAWAEPCPDSVHVRPSLHLTPFQRGAGIDIIGSDEAGEKVTSVRCLTLLPRL